MVNIAGRILNRFSKDVSTMDDTISMVFFEFVVVCYLFVIVIIVIIVIFIIHLKNREFHALYEGIFGIFSRAVTMFK